ncbi:MAG: class II aldolase/adducin family protein [Gammaproteobacteria bacterium]
MTAPTHAPTAHAKYLKRDAQALIRTGKWIDQRQGCPATGGNFSTRLNSEHVLITRSGCHKGELTEQDLLLVDLSGTPLTDQQTASAETLLHTTLYALDKHINMPMLANALRQRWTETPLAWGFLVRGHGLYSWGDTIESARRHLEGLEFLFACQLELQKLNITSTGLTP